MACDITSGYTLGCRDNTGGIKNVYILSGSVAGLTGEDVGLITEISGSGTFYKYELTRQTGDYTETINASLENGTVFYEQVVNAPFHKMESTLRKKIKILEKNPALKIIVETNNGEDATAGKFFYLGQQNGLSLSGGSGATGTAFGDMNGYTLTFTGQEPLPASEVTAPLASSLTGIAVG